MIVRHLGRMSRRGEQTSAAAGSLPFIWVKVIFVQRRQRRKLLCRLGEEAAQVRVEGVAAGDFLAGQQPVTDLPAVAVAALTADAELLLGAVEGACGKASFLRSLPEVARAARAGGQELLDKGCGPVARTS